MKTARAGGTGRGSVSYSERVEGSESTRHPATPQCPADELAIAEREALAAREAIRAAITAYNRCRGPNLAGELKRLYDEAHRRLADVRRAIREQGRR